VHNAVDNHPSLWTSSGADRLVRNYYPCDFHISTALIHRQLRRSSANSAVIHTIHRPYYDYALRNYKNPSKSRRPQRVDTPPRVRAQWPPRGPHTDMIEQPSMYDRSKRENPS